MEAQKDSLKNNNEYHSLWLVWSTCAFVDLVSLSLESCCTPEEQQKLQEQMIAYKEMLAQKESKRASEKRRAREDVVRAREVQERIPPVPQLVTTYWHSLSGILWAHNHF